MMNSIIIVLLTSIFVGTQSVVVEDCGSKLGSFNKVSITDCDGPDPVCILKRSTNVTIKIDFTTNVAVQTVKAVVHGVIQGMPVPYPIPNPNGCSKSGLTCPLSKGSPQDYTASFPVQHSYPKVHVTVRWELKNEAEDDILCINIPAQIK